MLKRPINPQFKEAVIAGRKVTTIREKPVLPADSGRTADCKEVRELMLALEYLRWICEHADGRTEKDQEMLNSGRQVGVQMLARHGALLEDFQRVSYWKEVWKVPSILKEGGQ